ncbi:zinc-binding oxidoreductase [Blastomyces dermatitidis ATCC 18188]|uniref:Zinc-binding oxidoreductase n=1 Tax=Ajellomyces dermatitidis (strain ATCC 18188 / CBS 674.68) TaxID=653446 RepID=F2TTA2_AJEDA|nr:zinc-binding oxidoreductase [Blastomyces dermatitidis ATCC 18188]
MNKYTKHPALLTMDQTPRTHTTTLAEQDNIPPKIPALYMPLPPSHPYTTTNPPPPSALLYTPSHPTPTPTKSQYLVKIQTTALCRGELGWAETLFPDPPHSPPTTTNTTTTTTLNRIPGHDISGIVLSTPQTDSRSVTGPKFKVGDEVIGLLAFARDGGAADVAVAVEGELAFKPRNVSAGQAACVPLSALTAWQALFEQAGVRGWVRYSDESEGVEEGEKEKEKDGVRRVLVLNASGGVGVMICQMLRAKMLFGEEARGGRFWVCGVCSGRNAGFVRDELGVDEVVDYTQEKEGLAEAFRKRAWEPVDLVLDCIGGQTLRQAYDPAVVRDGGIIISVAQPVPEQEPEWAGVRDAIAQRGLRSRFFIVRPVGEQLEKISLLVEKGELKAFVEKEMELYQGREAMELVESRRSRGKVVLRVNCYDR